jgi:signal peptidase I
MTKEYVEVNGTGQELPNVGFAELMAAVLAKGAPFRFQANGFSMSPFIRDGDVITLAPTPARLRFGDVAAFVNPCNHRLSVHRVIQSGRQGYLTRGDNNPKPDGTISHADMLGLVIRVERRGRGVWLGLGLERVGIALLSRYGWLMPIMVPIRFIYNILRKRLMT